MDCPDVARCLALLLAPLGALPLSGCPRVEVAPVAQEAPLAASTAPAAAPPPPPREAGAAAAAAAAPGDDAGGASERECHEDSDCKSAEICSYISMAYSFCIARPPVPTCPAGQIALKTGTCFTPCKTDADCAAAGPGLCCLSDPNAPTTICMSKC